ncbi:ATP-binding protein [Alkalihalobacterium chitinilyticum]|uniref:histidine kinase n=1 Tax=Alkalihalobacterium chitinilyticum TaxID=2980103 RepID=A0ABT5VH81_9BACI|nr:ATP-binding protein [Alkalihalobacterium chitinilyticum]MDE5414803.1 ATP-binding protein [Alkalihalobacterium chitinilyticum]
MEGIEQLLLNVLFIIVFLLFIPILVEMNAQRLSKIQKNWIVILSASLAIISCISFPITIMDGYFFDLRLVVLTVAGLYGGVSASILLAGVTIMYRFIVGGAGASATLIVVIILLFCIILLTDYFRKTSRKNKIMLGSSLSLFAALLAIINSTLIFGAPFSYAFLFIFLTLTFCTAFFTIYLYEVFQETLLIKKRIIKAEKMDIVSHLASSVSHEVRNPLTVIKGFLQMMEQNDIPEEQRKKFIKISIEEVDRANDIIRNYLTFAKPSPENKTKLNVKVELERTIQIITPLANMNGVEIVTKLESYFTEGETQAFQQCLLNLTKNCIEAMPDGGKLYIETKEENGDLVIVISDNGKGMTKEQVSRLGEPYFTTKGREGTGLGMMAAINIIETMAGKLSVTSKVNEGTNFHIRLPIVEECS